MRRSTMPLMLWMGVGCTSNAGTDGPTTDETLDSGTDGPGIGERAVECTWRERAQLAERRAPDIAFSTPDVGVVLVETFKDYGDSGDWGAQIWFTEDGGATWTVVWEDRERELVGLHQIDDQTLVATGLDLWISRDQGRTWKLESEQGAEDIWFFDADVGVRADWTKMSRTLDGGATWQEADPDETIRFGPAGSDGVVAWGLEHIRLCLDQGATCTRIHDIEQTGSTPGLPAFYNANRGLMPGYELWLTHDGGATWTVDTPGEMYLYYGVQWLGRHHVLVSAVAQESGEEFVLLESLDGGLSWDEIVRSGAPLPFAVSWPETDVGRGVGGDATFWTCDPAAD